MLLLAVCNDGKLGLNAYSSHCKWLIIVALILPFQIRHPLIKASSHCEHNCYLFLPLTGVMNVFFNFKVYCQRPLCLLEHWDEKEESKNIYFWTFNQTSGTTSEVCFIQVLLACLGVFLVTLQCVLIVDKQWVFQTERCHFLSGVTA